MSLKTEIEIQFGVSGRAVGSEWGRDLLDSLLMVSGTRRNFPASFFLGVRVNDLGETEVRETAVSGFVQRS